MPVFVRFTVRSMRRGCGEFGLACKSGNFRLATHLQQSHVEMYQNRFVTRGAVSQRAATEVNKSHSLVVDCR